MALKQQPELLNMPKKLFEGKKTSTDKKKELRTKRDTTPSREDTGRSKTVPKKTTSTSVHSRHATKKQQLELFNLRKKLFEG